MAVETEFETLFRDVFPRLVSLGALKTGRVDVARDGCVTDVPTAADLTWDGLYGIGTDPQRIRVAWHEGTRSIFGLPIQSS